MAQKVGFEGRSKIFGLETKVRPHSYPHNVYQPTTAAVPPSEINPVMDVPIPQWQALPRSTRNSRQETRESQSAGSKSLRRQERDALPKISSGVLHARFWRSRGVKSGFHVLLSEATVACILDVLTIGGSDATTPLFVRACYRARTFLVMVLVTWVYHPPFRALRAPKGSGYGMQAKPYQYSSQVNPTTQSRALEVS